MHFGQPLWIVIGLFACTALFGVIAHLQRRRAQALEKFASKKLLEPLTRNVSTAKRRLKVFLAITALFTCFVALARPQFGYEWIDVKRKGIDILFAVDTSASMLAEDIHPNRLERSKYAVLDFINQLEGDRIGLMPFAGSAFLMCPLTIDYSAFEQSLQTVDTAIVPDPGTNIAEAIRHGESVLKNDANYKLLIIITDGENLQGDAIQAAADAAAKGMTIFTVGVGTASGELIPIDVDGKQHYIKDRDGKFVTSRLDEESLQNIAEKTNGMYVPLGNRGQGLETLYQQKLAMIPKEELAEKRHKIPIERFQWALAAAIFLYIIEFLLNSRKTTPLSFNIVKRLRKKRISIAVILVTLLLFRPQLSMASPGEEAYRQGDFLSSSQYYSQAMKKEPKNPLLHFNYGAAAYKNNLYDEAIASFNTALQSDDLQLQEKAYYNRGNALYRKGLETLHADPQNTTKSWQEAITSYDASLQLQPDNGDALFNRDLVQRQLEELQKQEEQNKTGQQGDQGENNSGNEESGQSEKGAQQDSDENQQRQQEESNAPDAQPDSPDKNGDNEKQSDGDKQAAPTPEQSQEAQAEESEEGREMTPGKMTREEAEQLLNELKNEEGNLNFVPQHSNSDGNSGGRDW